MSRFGRRIDLRGRTAQRKLRGFTFTVSDLEQRTMMSVTTGLVADINQVDSTPTNLTEENGKLFFVTQDSAQGTASLWATDGTAQGAVKLASVAGTDYGSPSNSEPFVSAGGEVYFMGNDSSGEQGLFKSDGTAAGTALVAPVTYPGSNLATAGGKVIFTENGPAGLELWSSDGTATGTTELSSTVSSSYLVGTTGAHGNLVYFVSERPGASSSQLWASDGTPGGTVKLTDLPEGSGLSSVTTLAGNNVVVGTVGEQGSQLWATDGTPGGTMPLTNLSDTFIGLVRSLNGALYFDTFDSTTNTGQLWTSDGTASGTVPVATTGGSFNSAVDLTAVGNTIYFYGANLSETDTTPTAQLWAINGGTAAPVAPSISWHSLTPLTALNDKVVLFAADDGSGHGQELWESDGTATGTTMVKDLNVGPAGSISMNYVYNSNYGPSSSSPMYGLTVADGVAYFTRRRQHRRSGIVEERRHGRRHVNGEGHRPWLRQLVAGVANERRRHALFRGARWKRLEPDLEERWHGRRYYPRAELYARTNSELGSKQSECR